jgi:hypothetical protein
MLLPATLAVCRSKDAFFLFYCDADWQPMTDSWHRTLEEAKVQAEFEFSGIGATWQSA